MSHTTLYMSLFLLQEPQLSDGREYILKVHGPSSITQAGCSLTITNRVDVGLAVVRGTKPADKKGSGQRLVQVL